jgi:hypothetical protein
MAALRDAHRGLAEGQAEAILRLDTLAAAQAAVSTELGARKRRGRSAEAAVRMAAVSATTEDLVREHQQLKAQLVMLEQAADTAARTAARRPRRPRHWRRYRPTFGRSTTSSRPRTRRLPV